MVRTTVVAAAVLVLLLAPALPAASAAAPAPSPDTGASDGVEALTEPIPVQRNTTAVLLFGPDERGALDTPGPDLSTALATGHDTTAGTIDDRTLRRRYAAADNETRRDLLSAALERISARIDGLDATERTVRRGYANGTYTSSEAVERLAGLDPVARSLDDTLGFAERKADDLSADDLRSTARTLRSSLVAHYGPVRERLADAVVDGGPSAPTYAAGTASGVRFGVVENGTHYHESYEFPETTSQSPSGVSIDAAEERASDLYPWAWNASTRTTIDVVGSETYRVTLHHPHGTLTSYIDVASLDVIKETQRTDLTAYPPGPATEPTESGDLAVVVNRTYPGGPLRVRALDTDGAPVNASVRVANEDAGYTGDDGVAWAVGGGGNAFTVTLEHGEDQVSKSVLPLSS